MNNELVVEDGRLILPDHKVTLENLELGKWKRSEYANGSKLFLHETLGLEAATKLSVWEDATPVAKVTKNLDGHIVGVAVKGS